MVLSLAAVKLLLLLAITSCLTSARVCPIPTMSCIDKNTCCLMPQGDKYACCPYASAECCSDRIHCCPQGYECDIAHDRCARKSAASSILALFQGLLRADEHLLPLTPLLHGESVAETLPEGSALPEEVSAGVQGSINLKFSGHHYPSVLKALNNGTHLVLDPCPDKTACPDTYTCCPFANGTYGCCPFSNAVCCADHLTCCPQNTKCVPGNTCQR